MSEGGDAHVIMLHVKGSLTIPKSGIEGINMGMLTHWGRRYAKKDTIFAGWHTDLNFITIHGKSNYPGLRYA